MLLLALAGCGEEAALPPAIQPPVPSETVSLLTVYAYVGGESHVLNVSGEGLDRWRDWLRSLTLGEEVHFPAGSDPGAQSEGGSVYTIDWEGVDCDLSYRDFGDCYLVIDGRWYPVSTPADPPL